MSGPSLCRKENTEEHFTMSTKPLVLIDVTDRREIYKR